jgi:hypothetical protein
MKSGNVISRRADDRGGAGKSSMPHALNGGAHYAMRGHAVCAIEDASKSLYKTDIYLASAAWLRSPKTGIEGDGPRQAPADFCAECISPREKDRAKPAFV